MNIKKVKVAQEPSLKYTSNLEYRKPPKIANPYLQSLGAPHIDSFNFMFQDGLKIALGNILPVEFENPGGDKITITIEDAKFSKPAVPMETVGVKNQKVLPTECRQRATTYKGDFKVRMTVDVNGISTTVDRSVGNLPIMVRSQLCHLADLSPEELVEHNEHADEWGGYFIIKGHERLARMLLVTRRNYPVTIRRPTWKMRGNLFSEYGVMLRCVTSDQTSTNNVLHFLTNGTCKLMFGYRKMMYYAPLLLIIKCLVDHPDHYIYRLLLHGKKNDLYYVNCIQNMIRELHEEGLHTAYECRSYLGRMFRPRLETELPKGKSDLEVAQFLLDRCVMIHLNKDVDKFHGLVFMAQKLFDFVQNKCKVEGQDAVMCQEVLLGGHLYLQVLKERLANLMNNVRIAILKKKRAPDTSLNIEQKDLIQMIKSAGAFENRMETFLATGNAPSSYVNLPQYKGLTIVAENINRMRYMSHFKSIHRGAFFMEMRTTEARALLPDAWGFVCPVHTPDGAPCGLLNHLTATAQITQRPDPALVYNLPAALEKCGMEPISCVSQSPLSHDEYKYPVFIDGRLVGYFSEHTVHRAAAHLRTLKVKGEEMPITTEIVVIPKKQICAQYAGMFLMTHEARMMRPVIHLASGQLELIGTMEQLYLDIAVTNTEIIKGKTTHLELSKSAFMSHLAQLVPMPDCNQSPRNMYQCQMGKQTMGTPIHTWATNAETKLYRLQTPATPLFRPTHYDNIGLDDFPMGTNAIVAVISYSGYDMEDAMIINKSAYERGFAAGAVYKSEFVELTHAASHFARDPTKPDLSKFIDEDGLPAIGARIAPDDPYYCYFDGEKNNYSVKKYHGKEDAYVDSVRQCGDFKDSVRKACIVLRVQRNPFVGDKFASRAGQKGICSQKWTAEDLPFTESGLVPDVLFNPHGFPSRMTIAMMIECMAGKAASLHGHRPRYKKPSYATTDTSIDDSFDITPDEKNGDETYVPSADDYNVNSSLSFTDTSNTTSYLNEIQSTTQIDEKTCMLSDHISNKETVPRGIDYSESPQHTLLSDSPFTPSSPMYVANYITVEENDATSTLNQQMISDSFQMSTNVLVNDSDNSFIENLNISYMMQSTATTQVQGDVYIPLSESENSNDVTNNDTITPQPLSTSTYEQTTVPVETRASTLSPNANCITTNSDFLNSPGGTISEYDDSDRDETFNPTPMESSSDTSHSSDEEEMYETTLNDGAENKIQPLCHGLEELQVYDATPFRFNEKDSAINYFGRLLEAGGYNYYGTERMYSGVDGREMTADIFYGVIHYQRLRHMVSDKWQVRTTGVVDALTRQPVKGRRRGGGVRLGEMERDALVSHGAAFLLQDRLFHCSDKTEATICTKCGTLLGPIIGNKASSSEDSCRLCGTGQLASVAIPYVFKLFVTQLACVNINVKINCNEVALQAC